MNVDGYWKHSLILHINLFEMTITQIFLLLVCAFVLVLVLSTLFKRYHRIIMWSAAIVFFIGTLLLIGLGIIDPVKDNHPDPVVITGIVTALILSGLFAYGAEKLRIKLREKNQQTVQSIDNQPECPDSPKGVVLSGRLDTSLARTIFAKAIEAGYIEEVGSHYSWKGTKALLAYIVVEYIAAIFLNIPNTNRRLFGSLVTGSSPMSSLTHYLNRPESDSPGRTGGICPSLTMPEKSTSFFRSDKKRRVLSSFLASLSFWLVMHFVLLHLAIFDFFNFIFSLFYCW